MEKKIKVHEKNTMLVWAQVSFYTFLWDEGAKRDNSLLNLKNTCNFSNQMFSYKLRFKNTNALCNFHTSW